MLYRKFGSLDTEVSVVGFGGGAVSGSAGGYSFGAMSDAEATTLLHACHDAGINLFDTAPIYGYGTSERRMGAAFKDRRDQVFLVSKCGVTWDEAKENRIDNSPAKTTKMLEQSLRDMQTDYFDLYMVHWPDAEVDIRETMAVLAEAQQAGKIRALGLSNTNADEVALAREVADIAVVQAEYNLFKPDVESYLFPAVDAHNLGFMSWGTLDKGILSGRVTRERTFTDKTDSRARAPWWLEADHEFKFVAMDQINPLLKEAGHTPLELALGFVLNAPQTSTALCGLKNAEQVKSACEAVHRLPGRDIIAECVAIVAGARPDTAK